VPLDGLVCWPLPGPAFVRHLTLIARRQELGRLPRDIATFCRTVLTSQTSAVTRNLGVWLGDHFRVED
jgi:hypothetical protein